MKKIPIPHKGKTEYALVDDIDYPRLIKIRWNIQSKNFGVKKYAVYTWRDDLGAQIYIPMHSFINNTHGIGRDGNLETDHINGDSLDNRRANLRKASHSQNSMNKPQYINNTSGYKGVSWSKAHKRWRAAIRSEGKTYFIGEFLNAFDAAKAYDRRAKELFGEFAYLNFPDEETVQLAISLG